MTGAIVATLTDLQQHMKQGSKPTQQAVHVSKTLGISGASGQLLCTSGIRFFECCVTATASWSKNKCCLTTTKQNTVRVSSNRPVVG